jgi:AcrR family transcriptional regulator
MSQGLRERKKAETRQALMAAALRLAEEHGPDRVTVDGIADAAGVSPRTFFNYFSTRDDAIAGIAPAHSSDLLASLVARPEGEAPLDALRGAAHDIAETLEGSAEDWMRRRDLFRRYPVLAARFAAGFAEVERGMVEVVARRTGLDPDRDTYPSLAVAAALGAIRAAIAVWWARDRPPRFTALLDAAFDQLATGLRQAG